MTNEAAAVAVQLDEIDISVLWDKVKYFARKQAKRWLEADNGRGGCDLDDLLQEAFIALYDTLDRYEPERGKFLPLYSLRLKSAFSAALGREQNKVIPLRCSSSLDATIYDDEKKTLYSVIPDPETEGEIDRIIDKPDITEQMRAIEKYTSCLSDKEAEAIMDEFLYDDRIPDKGALATGLKALQQIHNPKETKQKAGNSLDKKEARKRSARQIMWDKKLEVSQAIREALIRVLYAPTSTTEQVLKAAEILKDSGLI